MLSYISRLGPHSAWSLEPVKLLHLIIRYDDQTAVMFCQSPSVCLDRLDLSFDPVLQSANVMDSLILHFFHLGQTPTPHCIIREFL